MVDEVPCNYSQPLLRPDHSFLLCPPGLELLFAFDFFALSRLLEIRIDVWSLGFVEHEFRQSAFVVDRHSGARHIADTSRVVLRRIPKRNASLCSRILRKLSRRRSINLRNPRCRVLLYELNSSRQRCDEVLRELRKGRLTDHDEQLHVVAHHSGEFIRLVTDASVVGNRDPALASNRS